MTGPPSTRKWEAGPLAFNLLALLIGLASGAGAVFFRGLIALVHNLLFLGQFSVAYDANVHTPPGPWGPLVIFGPVMAGFFVVFLVKNFAPEAKGHGVPEVLEAIYYQKGDIRPVVGAVKSVASALSIGSGGSAGREGPMIQIGASFGSTVGQWLAMPPWQRITLVAAGAGGGIAASFNTPVGGILFAVEIVLHELSVRTLVPVSISTVAATYVSRLVFGPHPSFLIPHVQLTGDHAMHIGPLLCFVGLGIVTGLASALFIKTLYAFEDFFDKRLGGSYYLRHMAAMFLIGLAMYAMMIAFGHYYIEGVGYATVQDLLDGALTAVPLLLLLFALKLLATSLTLGSGASGGVFSPAFFMGATLGGSFGLVLAWLFPSLGIGTTAFVVAGMAGVVGGSTGAALAAVVMIFEMTGDYEVIIPITVTVALSYGVRRALSPESIYTLKLVRRGRRAPWALHADLGQVRLAQDIMRPVEAPERAAVMERLGRAAETPAVVARCDAPLAEVLEAMRRAGASTAIVTSDGAQEVSASAVRGVITEHEISQAMIRSGELFGG